MVPAWTIALILVACGTRNPAPPTPAPTQLSGAEIYAVLPPEASGGLDGCVLESTAGDAIGCLFHRLDNGRYITRFEAWSTTGKALDATVYSGWPDRFDPASVDAEALARANMWLRTTGARAVTTPPLAASTSAPPELPRPEQCCAWRPTETRRGKAYTVTVFTQQCCFELNDDSDPPDDACAESWASTPDELDACHSAHPAPRRTVHFTSRPASP